MSQRHIELEIRKSVALGRFWESMLKDSVEQKIPEADFFQKIYKGSALEGLSLVAIRSTEKLAGFVSWLESQTTPPDWGKEILAEFESRLQKLHNQGLHWKDLDESKRFNIQEEVYSAVIERLSRKQMKNLPFVKGPQKSNNVLCRVLKGS